jgi:predicted proteasome-type protease
VPSGTAPPFSWHDWRRTNAVVDNLSEHSKMYVFGTPGDRRFILCAAGNLAATQGMVSQLERDIRDAGPANLMNQRSVADAAANVGQTSIAQQAKDTGVFAADSPYRHALRESWNTHVRAAFTQRPRVDWNEQAPAGRPRTSLFPIRAEIPYAGASPGGNIDA